MLTPELLIRDLAKVAPELKSIVDDHLEYYDELLPHVVFHEVVTWAERVPLDSHSLAGVLGLLESAYPNGDDRTRNLIDVSFLEDLPLRSPIYKMLGPHLMQTSIVQERM